MKAAIRRSSLTSLPLSPPAEHVHCDGPKAPGAEKRPYHDTLLARDLAAWTHGQTGRGRRVHPHGLRHTAVQKVFDLAGSIALPLQGIALPLPMDQHPIIWEGERRPGASRNGHKPSALK